MICECMLNVYESKHDGKNECVDFGICGRRLGTEIDEGGLEVSVPVEAVVATLPEGSC